MTKKAIFSIGDNKMDNHLSLEAQRPLLEVRDLKKHFTVSGKKGKSTLYALNCVFFSVKEGQTFGLVGESGCGKTTLGKVIMRLMEPTAGQVIFDGVDIATLSKQKLKKARRNIQMIFQDPCASLDPRMTVGKIICEPLVIHGIGDKKSRRETVLELLEVVGLQPSYYDRFPHEFSGGQMQRIGIARALVLHPKLIICDEPVSALDVSVQCQILNLLDKLQDTFGLTYIFIAHGLNVIKHVSDFVGVMYLGKMVEIAPADELFARPFHPYTEALLSAIPIANPRSRRERIVLDGEIPSPTCPPPGCCFHTRCRYCQEICTKEEPPLHDLGDRNVVCHFPLY